MDDIDPARYKMAPIKRFVDSYVLDVIGALPREQSESIQRLDLQRIFKTSASEWRQALRETLDLSETFDIAVLDLWYRWTAAMTSQGGDVLLQQFVAGFTDDYFAEGSQIDVWPPGSLEAAKARVMALRH